MKRHLEKWHICLTQDELLMKHNIVVVRNAVKTQRCIEEETLHENED